MSKVADLNRVIRRRFELFHKKCQTKCSSRKSFNNGFMIDRSHIAKGILKNPKRSALADEDIAAVISQGDLNFDTSNEGPPIEIAVNGIIKDFEWTDMQSSPIATYREEWVEVVVVVRERKPKDFIVTAYIIDDKKLKTAKTEIRREIW